MAARDDILELLNCEGIRGEWLRTGTITKGVGYSRNRVRDVMDELYAAGAVERRLARQGEGQYVLQWRVPIEEATNDHRS